MAKPQLEDGHTQIANEILEHLMKMYLPPNQWQVLLCIIRKTYGFHKKVDWIANSQIIEATGLVKSTVSRALKSLEQQKLISRNKKRIGFQKDWEEWQKVSSIANNEKLAIPQPKLADRKLKLAIQSTKVSSPLVTQKIKDTITKDTIQKKEKFILPIWIDKDTWDAFLEMRKSKRAMPTDKAIQLLIKELEKLKGEGHDPNEVLNQSTMRNYTGVFPVKGGQIGTHRGSPRSLTPRDKYTDPDKL